MNSYPYISRLVDLPPDLAKAAFDAVACRCAGDGARGWEVVVPSGLLALEGPGAVPLLPGSYGPYRKVRGVLRRGWSGLGASVPVELELLPWSASRTELGLTAMGGGGPWRPSLRRYLEIGGGALDALRSATKSWPDSLLGGLVDEWEEELALGGR